MDKRLKEIEKEVDKKIFFNGKIYIDRLMSVIEDNKILVFFSFIQIVLIVVLIIGYLGLSKNIKVQVELPPKIYRTGTIKVGAYQGNNFFYKVWGEYISRELGNYAPGNISLHLRNIEYLFSPEYFASGKTKFMELESYVKKNLIKHSFIPLNITVNKNKVLVAGVGESIVGDNLAKAYESCKYLIQFSVRNYRLFVDKIGMKCETIDKGKYEKIKHDAKVKEEHSNE